MGETKAKKGTKIEIDFDVLESIAKYYEFPVAVFFMPKENWTKRVADDKTRLSKLIKDSEKLDTIREILAE